MSRLYQAKVGATNVKMGSPNCLTISPLSISVSSINVFVISYGELASFLFLFFGGLLRLVSY